MTGVLVTGATTPFGDALIRALLRRNDVGFVLGIGIQTKAENLDDLVGERFRYERVDLTRERELHDLLFGQVRSLDIGVVFHAAMHRRARSEGARVHDLNVEATRNLLLLAERHPTLRRVVFKSSSSVYRIDPRAAALVTEDEPLELSVGSPQAVRDRVEADLTVCTRMGVSRLEIVVLRLAEILAPDVGSQLYDYLDSKLCLRPLGFNPMLNVLSLDDAVEACTRATFAIGNGVFNIPGADTLPLSRAILLSGARGVPIPGPLLAPLYRVRASALGMEFRYDLNYRRFHFSTVLDGTRAREAFGYVPRHPVRWALTIADRLHRRERRVPGSLFA